MVARRHRAGEWGASPPHPPFFFLFRGRDECRRVTKDEKSTERWGPKTLMPPPASAKGWEVRTRPAPPSEFPVPQPTYVSPPMRFAQRRSKQEQVAPGSDVKLGFTATWAIAQPPS